MYDAIAKSLLPTVTAFYIGSWCDVIGRKTVMYLYLISNVISQAIVVVNAYFIDWPKEALLAATLVQALCGEH